MPAILNTLKHLAYTLIALVGASLVAYFQDSASLAKVLSDGGLNAVYIALAVPAFQLLAVAIQNLLKHLSQS